VINLPDGQVWRHNQAGDLAHKNGLIDGQKLEQLAEANKGKKGFTYTHHVVEGNSSIAIHNREHIRRAVEMGFSINLSANSPSHADILFDLGVAPVTTLIPSSTSYKTSETPSGRKIITCPAALRDGVTCSKCPLCRNMDRDFIIGFPAHGSRRTTVDKRLSMETSTL
jgi:hypothetical protein